MTARASGRRALFTGTGAALLGTGLPVGAEAAPDADSALIAACARYVRAEAEWRRLGDLHGDQRSGTPEYRAAWSAMCPFRDGEYATATAAVCDLPARTRAGLRAKAAAVIAHFDPDPPDDGPMAAAMWQIVSAVAGGKA